MRWVRLAFLGSLVVAVTTTVTRDNAAQNPRHPEHRVAGVLSAAGMSVIPCETLVDQFDVVGVLLDADCLSKLCA